MANICIFGTGGVGGFFGSHLARYARDTKAEHKVYFVARGEHLKEIEKNGLTLKTPNASVIASRPDMATDDFSKLPSPDLIFVCVKRYDLKGALEQISSNIKNDTVIIPLLNGIDNYEIIRGSLAGGYVLPACVYVGTKIEKPGVISWTGGEGRIFTGKDPKYPDYKPDWVFELFDNAEIKYAWMDNPLPEIWKKYLFIASYGLVGVYSRKPLGGMHEDEKLRAMVLGVINEIALLASKEGVALLEDDLENALNKAKSFPFETLTSYQRDFAGGKNDEGELYWKAILRLGEKHGIDTPITRKIYESI